MRAETGHPGLGAPGGRPPGHCLVSVNGTTWNFGVRAAIGVARICSGHLFGPVPDPARRQRSSHAHGLPKPPPPEASPDDPAGLPAAGGDGVYSCWPGTGPPGGGRGPAQAGTANGTCHAGNTRAGGGSVLSQGWTSRPVGGGLPRAERWLPIQVRRAGVGSLVKKRPSDPAPGQSACAGDRVAPDYGGTAGRPVRTEGAAAMPISSSVPGDGAIAELSEPAVRPVRGPPLGRSGESEEWTLRLAQEHDRIAVGMNEIVVRRLFSAGLSLQTALGLMDGHRAAGKVQQAIGELDLAITDFRDVLFDHDRADRVPSATAGWRAPRPPSAQGRRPELGNSAPPGPVAGQRSASRADSPRTATSRKWTPASLDTPAAAPSGPARTRQPRYRRRPIVWVTGCGDGEAVRVGQLWVA